MSKFNGKITRVGFGSEMTHIYYFGHNENFSQK